MNDCHDRNIQYKCKYHNNLHVILAALRPVRMARSALKTRLFREPDVPARIWAIRLG